jgi:hypothetical protein
MGNTGDSARLWVGLARWGAGGSAQVCSVVGEMVCGSDSHVWGVRKRRGLGDEES